MKKLAIVVTHPIQYYSPWFRLLDEKDLIEVKVFYTWSQSKHTVKDQDFGKNIKWDIPLLVGYEYEFINNISKNPGSNRWNGIDNPELIHKIENFRPSAILIFGWNMKSHFKVMKYFKNKIPVWFRGDSTLIDEKNNLKKIIRRIWLRYIYNHIDKAFYVGKANKNYYKAVGLKEEQLILAPHAIDNLRFSSNGEEYDKNAEEWRKKLGYKANDLIILFAGKFDSKKSPSFLIKAVQEVNKEVCKKVYLLMVGTGPLEQEIQGMIKGDSNIKILPFQNQSQMPIIYRLGDVYCLPSKGPGETWGLAVNEAMASGRGVIVSNKVGCSEDVVIHNHNGFVFESGNKDQLKLILSNLTKEKCEIFGENSANHICQWNFSKIIEALELELELQSS